MDKVLGIDLGTSTSCVAVMVDGKPVVIPDKDGVTIQPSIVNFRPDGRILVGKEAKPYVIQDAENTVTAAKRLIGRKFFSAEVKKAKALMPYEIIEGENQSAQIRIQQKSFTLQEISAMILKKMKAIAEEYFGEPISRAVVTVPAYFNDNQRAATKDAGKIAGLDVLRIINEPTAAALAYGYGKAIRQRVAVYDLGGGTFDVSVLELGDDVFEVISTSGDTYLGGEDFDDRIIDWASAKFLASHNFDLRKDRMTLQQLKDAAERGKVELTVKEVTKIFIPAVTADTTGFVDLDFDLPRAEFEGLITDLIQRTFKVCDEAMQMARLTPSDIGGVILVGGPTRSPSVRNAVMNYFQREPLADIHPDEVVATGAAIQGGALTGESKDVVLVDLTPLSLGIEIRGGLVERIVELNTPVPADHTKIFTTTHNNQESVKIRVFQGEKRKAAENELLGEFTLSGLSKAQAGDVSVAVQFEVDTNGILNVTAKDVETGKSQSVRLQSSGRLSEERLKELQGSTDAVVTK
ncbi:MAG: molecular chaperone DnaK [Pseudomonadota bacterium]